LAGGINVVQDGICIGLMRGCKDADLEELVSLLQALEKVGTQVETGLKGERWEITLTVSFSSGKKIDRTKSGRSTCRSFTQWTRVSSMSKMIVFFSIDMSEKVLL